MPTSNLTLNQWTQIYIGGSSLVDQYVQVSAGKALISLGTPSDATTVIDSSSFDDKVIYVPAATSVYARPNGVPFTTVSWGNYGSGQSVAGYELAASYLAGVGVVPKASRIVASAQRSLGDISAVMASPPTITNPLSDGANSTIQTGRAPTTAASGAGQYDVANPAHCTLMGGPISGGRIQTITKIAGTVVAGHSAGFAFCTDAPDVDFSIRCNGQRWIASITDLTAGVRARISASDLAQAYANANWYKLGFGGAGLRQVEVYSGSASNIYGICVAAGYSVWPASGLAAQPKLALIWDSFGEGSMNNGNLNLKLATADWIAARLGCNTIHVNALGSTGVLANAAAASNNFQQRLDAGDMDVSRVGSFDLIFAPGSVNDNTVMQGGLAIPAGDATIQGLYQTYISTLMAKQPHALIVGFPQEFGQPSGTPTAATASRVAAYKAGFLAAANGNPRMIWLDGSLFESTPSTGVIGADNIHPGDVAGARNIGTRLAEHTLRYLNAMIAV